MSGPLRVLQLANQAGPLRLFMLPVCRAMRDAGWNVELACMKLGPNYDPLEREGFVLHALRAGPWSCPLTLWRTYRGVRALLARGRYDLMVVHTPVMSWIARLAARGLVGKVVYMCHGLPFMAGQCPVTNAAMRRMELLAGRYTDAILVMNQADEDACRRWRMTRSGGQVFRIPGVGVDVGAWSSPLDAASRATLDAELGLSRDRPVVLYLGRFIATKRPGDVLELARRTGAAAQYVLAGEGPLWRTIARQAKAIGEHVHVLGWTDRSVDLMRRCDIVVFPSVFREGLPRMLLEAAAAGKPAVAYAVRGATDAIVDGQTGLLVRPGDVDGFCAAARRLLGDAGLRTQLGQTAANRAGKEFDLPRAVAAQMQAIRKVIE